MKPPSQSMQHASEVRGRRFATANPSVGDQRSDRIRDCLSVGVADLVLVPEPSSLLLLMVAGSFSCLFHGGRPFLKNKAGE
jgi:hypothetical protein